MCVHMAKKGRVLGVVALQRIFLIFFGQSGEKQSRPPRAGQKGGHRLYMKGKGGGQMGEDEEDDVGVWHEKKARSVLGDGGRHGSFGGGYMRVRGWRGSREVAF
jgi:hypothetical protein